MEWIWLPTTCQTGECFFFWSHGMNCHQKFASHVLNPQKKWNFFRLTMKLCCVDWIPSPQNHQKHHPKKTTFPQGSGWNIKNLGSTTTTTHISGIYCQLGDYMPPATFNGNQKQPLNSYYPTGPTPRIFPMNFAFQRWVHSDDNEGTSLHSTWQPMESWRRNSGDSKPGEPWKHTTRLVDVFREWKTTQLWYFMMGMF